ncbi:MAG TPA: hypothetical protein PKI05_04975 [Thermogutta sp.]|nr:hypothetical protein [Thermogutta sp.]
MRKIVAIIVAMMLAVPLVGCDDGDWNDCQSWQSSTEQGETQTVYILIQPSSNSEELATHLRNDLKPFLESLVEKGGAPLRLEGWAYGGLGTPIRQLKCMNGAVYPLKSPNSQIQRELREVIPGTVVKAASEELMDTQIGKTRADALPLLLKISKPEKAHVFLWSQFNANGEYCLQETLPAPIVEQAKKKIQGCVDAGDIHVLPGLASFTINGLGVMTDEKSRNMQPYSLGLAKYLCEAVTGSPGVCHTPPVK